MVGGDQTGCEQPTDRHVLQEGIGPQRSLTSSYSQSPKDRDRKMTGRRTLLGSITHPLHALVMNESVSVSGMSPNPA